jgi:hypothetical protein
MRRERERAVTRERDGAKILLYVERQLREKTRHRDRRVREQQRVAVGRAARHDLGAEHRCRARAVVYYDLLPERLRELLGEHPG